MHLCTAINYKWCLLLLLVHIRNSRFHLWRNFCYIRKTHEGSRISSTYRWTRQAVGRSANYNSTCFFAADQKNEEGEKRMCYYTYMADSWARHLRSRTKPPLTHSRGDCSALSCQTGSLRSPKKRLAPAHPQIRPTRHMYDWADHDDERTSRCRKFENRVTQQFSR